MSTFDEQTINQVIAFHRHSCPGLAIGIRAAEYALQHFPDTDPADFVCVTETDMCAVDAIQYLTGCSFGKGNLIHHDYGKAAFSFFDRKQQTGIRLLFTPQYPEELRGGFTPPSEKNAAGISAEQEQKDRATHREKMKQWLMTCPLDAIYTLKPLKNAPPKRARILESLSCDNCREKTMESRTRRFMGKTLCIPCFNKVEQKI